MARPPEPTLLDRILVHFRSIVRAEFPELTYFGLYEYAVQAVSADGSTVDAVPTDSTINLPGIVKIPLRPSVIGEQVTLAAGQAGVTCLVMFVNGDPTRPALISISSSTPTTIALAGGANFVALANLVSAQLALIATALTVHVHGGVATGSGTSGVAASVYVPGAVAAGVVKAS